MAQDETCSTPQGGINSGNSSYPSDCELTQALLEKARKRQESTEKGYVWKSCLPRAKGLKLFLLDVDGILTDGTITYTHEGNEIKSFHTRDGLGIRLIMESGIEVGLITARESEAVNRRVKDLKIKYVFQKAQNKLVIFENLLKELDLEPSEVGYMGDDWLDLPLLVRVGFAATVADAVPEVLQAAHYVTKRKGGRGAVREVCDLILEAQGTRSALLEKYLKI
jgi:3-deoxy-D-manno-octulosonate 8-phosphate phosphatase (KDO 8-P phosphatase)